METGWGGGWRLGFWGLSWRNSGGKGTVVRIFCPSLQKSRSWSFIHPILSSLQIPLPCPIPSPWDFISLPYASLLCSGPFCQREGCPSLLQVPGATISSRSRAEFLMHLRVSRMCSCPSS